MVRNCLNLTLVRLIVVILITQGCFCYVVIKNDQKTPKKTYIKSLSENIINFFNFYSKENLIKNSLPNPGKKPSSYIDRLLGQSDKNDESCSDKTPDYFVEYFFDVYSEANETSINKENFREMVKFHLTRGPRSEEIEKRSATNKCKSDDVNFQICILLHLVKTFTFYDLFLVSYV